MFDYAWNREFKTQRRTPQLTMERCYYIRHLDKLSLLKIAQFHPLQNIAVKDSQSAKCESSSSLWVLYLLFSTASNNADMSDFLRYYGQLNNSIYLDILAIVCGQNLKCAFTQVCHYKMSRYTGRRESAGVLVLQGLIGRPLAPGAMCRLQYVHSN